MNAVRVVPMHKAAETSMNKLMHRHPNKSVFSRMSWYTNMIRSMSMGSMCYDCSITSMFAKSMMLALTGVALDEKIDEDADWREHYVRELDLGRIVN